MSKTQLIKTVFRSSLIILIYRRFIMKAVDSKKPVKTIPDGVWESSHDTARQDNPYTSRKKEQDAHFQNAATDLQGNGYPVPKSSDNSNQSPS